MYLLGQIFNSQFFITLGIVILLIVIMTIYTEQKYSEYDHKLSEVKCLVTNIKNELSNKSEISSVTKPADLNMETNTDLGTYTIEPKDLLITSLSNFKSTNDLIEISDAGSESESESESESDYESHSESESESDTESVLEDSIKIVNLESVEDEIETVYLNVEKTVSNEPEEVVHSEVVETEIVETEPESLPTLVITDVVSNQNESNLKKMSFAQLEQLAVSHQLVELNNHKLKKKELLKLLQDFEQK